MERMGSGKSEPGVVGLEKQDTSLERLPDTVHLGVWEGLSPNFKFPSNIDGRGRLRIIPILPSAEDDEKELGHGII